MTPGDLATRAAALDWYHSIDLGGGVVTRGLFDTRATVAKVPLPASLAGKRCLDVGTWDGFWAFEMERRGAAEVVAIDIEDHARWDWPPRARLNGAAAAGSAWMEDFKSASESFAFAREALGSNVERRDQSLYELTRATVGRFDFVFMGSLLLHLRDPVAALAALRTVCTGEAVFADTVDVIPSLLRPRTPTARLDGLERPWWWMANVAAVRRWVQSAGWEIVERRWIYALPFGPAHEAPSVARPLRSLLSPEGRERHVISRLGGLPHTALRARPL